MNNDLISREALKKDIQTEWLTAETKQTFYKIIDNAPTVEPQKVLVANVTFDKDELKRLIDEQVIEPIKNGELVLQTDERPHGEWIDHSDDYGYAECPFCEHLTTCGDNIDELHYCWNCGAELKKGVQND